MSLAVHPGGNDARGDGDRSAKLPVTLLSGFLGSGKTTLLSRLLRHERMRDTAVVINEFGEIALDHLLVAEVDAQTVLLDGGCVCCAVRDDLAETLLALHAKRAGADLPAFNRIVIETSGLADPTAIAALLLRDPALARRFVLDAVVVTVDALHAPSQIDAQPEALRQILLADRLLLTKTDLVGEDDYWKLAGRLHALNPAARRLNCRFGDIDPGELIGLGARAAAETSADVLHWHAPASAPIGGHEESGCPHCHGRQHGTQACSQAAQAAHDDGIRAHCLRVEVPLEWDALSAWLGSIAFHHGDKLLRVKAIVNVRGEALPLAVHGVQRWLNAPEPLPAWPDEDRASRFVFIVRDLPRAALTEMLEAALRDAGDESPHAADVADPGDLAKNGRTMTASRVPATAAAMP